MYVHVYMYIWSCAATLLSQWACDSMLVVVVLAGWFCWWFFGAATVPAKQAVVRGLHRTIVIAVCCFALNRAYTLFTIRFL